MSPLVLTFAGLTALFVTVYLLGRLVRLRAPERVRCAQKGAEFDVLVERKLNALWEPGQPQDVVRCSAFADPQRLDCDKGCLKALMAPPPAA